MCIQCRVEFQQRGGPHVHCLKWLQDEKGEPAPTFWTTDKVQNESDREAENDEDMNEIMREDQILKIERIENIANMLISTSVSSAVCDKHYEEQMAKPASICRWKMQ